MNNLYNASNDGPNQSANQIVMFEDGCDPGTVNDLLLQNLDDSDGKQRIEYRYHKRFQLEKNAFALIRSIAAGPLRVRNKSMGCIACAVFNAKPVRLGKIDNISMGGLMFHHVDTKTQLSQVLVLDILLADCGFYLANLPFNIVTDVVIPDEVSSDVVEMRQVRLQFQLLNAIQQARLKDFIMNHGTDIEPRMTIEE